MILSNTVKYNGHTYEAGKKYRVTLDLERILVALDEKKKKKVVKEQIKIDK